MNSGLENSNNSEDLVRWGAGCLVAAAALTGGLILVFIISLALGPPAWVQVTIGVLLVMGGAFLAWLVATAVGQSEGQENRGTRQVGLPDDPRD